MLRPPTFRKGQVLHASDLNALAASVSSVTGQAFTVQSERGRLNDQQSVPRGLLGGAAMVTKFDPQGGACIVEGVMYVQPTVGVTAGLAPDWCCGAVLRTTLCEDQSLLAIKVHLDRYGRPTQDLSLGNCLATECRFAPWSYACDKCGHIIIPLAKKVQNCVVALNNSCGLCAYTYSMRNLTSVNVPVMTQNASKCSPGVAVAELPACMMPAHCNSTDLLTPLPSTNTVVARRLGGGAGVCVLTLGCLDSPDGRVAGALIGLKSGIQFSNLSCLGDGQASDWYATCKCACTVCVLDSPLSPMLNKWQRLAQFRLRIPVTCGEYSTDGRLCNIRVVNRAKTIALEAYQQFPHIIQFRFQPQNLDFTS